jgi:lipoprotein-releasing system permease protein
MIAKRYFFSKHKKSFISIIANISMLGVGIGTMALVIVMAVFNGLEDLNRTIFKSFDPDIKITAKKGKNFLPSQNLIAVLSQIKGVENVSGVIEENALLKYRNAQSVVTVKGVEEDFLKKQLPDSTIINGRLKLEIGMYQYALLGYGVAYSLSASTQDEFTPLEVWYPQKGKNLSSISTENDFIKKQLLPSGIFNIEQNFDANHIYVSLNFAKEIFQYGKKLSSIEIKVKPNADLSQIQSQVKKQMGDNFVVQNEDEQHANLLRAIQIEKLFTFLALAFIIAVASFNIYFSLTMLAIEKKQDIKILYAMGADKSLIQNIFMYEGSIVALIGAATGLVLGITFCWIQQTFGFISMGSSTSILPALPVKMKMWDLIITTILVICITLSASYIPARRAANQI